MFAIVDLGAAVVISAFAGRLAQHFDKKRLAVVLFAGAIVLGPILLALRLLDIHYGLHLLSPNRPKYGPLAAPGYADDATAGVAAATN